MLEVLPIQSKEEQEILCGRCRVPYRPDALAYKALSEGEFCGVCQFTMDHAGGRILDFAALPGAAAWEPMFVMGRAALNFIDLCGVHRAFFDAGNTDETMIQSIGFSRNTEGRWEMDLTDFFREPCKHTGKQG